ncbi:hypothetical protein M728_001978 [Ensifer sp. WSM1721]
MAGSCENAGTRHLRWHLHADVIGYYGVYKGSNYHAIEQAAQIPVNDPIQLAAPIALATEHLGIGITASTSFEHPCTFARRWRQPTTIRGAGLEYRDVLSRKRREECWSRRAAQPRQSLRGGRRICRGSLQAFRGKLGGGRRAARSRAGHQIRPRFKRNYVYPLTSGSGFRAGASEDFHAAIPRGAPRRHAAAARHAASGRRLFPPVRTGSARGSG